MNTWTSLVPTLALLLIGCQSQERSQAERPPATAGPRTDGNATPAQASCVLPTRNIWSFISGEARMVPEIREGAVTGLRLYSVKSYGPLGRAGFRNADLITAVDGEKVSIPGLVPVRGSKVVFTVRRDSTETLIDCSLP